MKTSCCLCGTYDHSVEIYPANFDAKSFSIQVFSARRVPDRRSFRWVACITCGQYRSDPVENLNLESLYAESSFDYADESKNLAETYSNLIVKSLGDVSGKSVLEIGGGNGFVLEALLNLGVTEILGVEPSNHAIESASEAVKPFLIKSMFERGTVPEEAFDCVAMFHVMDHLPNPLETLEGIREALKRGGILVIAVHNVKSWSAKLFKSRSPIFDVEHTYLYSKKSAIALLQKAGFTEISARAYWNVYSLRYLVQLVPLPRALKLKIINGAAGQVLSRISIPVPLGNMVVLGSRQFQ